MSQIHINQAMTKLIRLFKALIIISILLGPTMPQAVAQSQPGPEPIDGGQEPAPDATGSETIKLTVPDCPGVTREIDASNLPPSIYPKPNCGGGTSGENGSTGPVGVCSLDSKDAAYGTSQTAPPEGSVFWTIVNGQTYGISQGFGPTSFALSPQGRSFYDGYNYTLNVEGHPGVDVDTPEGVKLYTPVGGTVIYDGGTPFFYYEPAGGGVGGPSVPKQGEFRLRLDNGDELIFGHMQTITVNKDQTIAAGTYIGLSGGMNGPHFHIEYRHKLAHANGEYTALDPRDVFGCASPTAPTPDGKSQPIALNSAQTSVLAEVAIARDMAEFQQKYGFPAPNGVGTVDISQYSANFAILRDLAAKYASTIPIEPEMIVWWSLAETAPPYDSYSYSNCMDQTREVDLNCPDPSSGRWQIGYGQQFAVFSLLKEAYTITHGTDTSAAAVQKIGQAVLQKAGISKTFPNYSLDRIIAGLSSSSMTDMNYWGYTLMRDPALSMWLLGKALSWDTGAAASRGMTLRELSCTWTPYYCNEAVWQRYANIMNDVLLNWGIAGSGIIGDVCLVGVPTSTSSCSSEPDNLNAMGVAEFTKRINQNMASYKKIAACANVPWEMMAAIHLRETGLDPDYRGEGAGGALGSWQIDPTGAVYGQVDPYNFEEAGCAVAKNELQAKAQSGPVGRPLSQDMDPTNKDAEYSIKDAFFAYNGRGGYAINIPKGCTENTDGNPEWNWDCSAYVMNEMDSQHKNMCINTADFCPKEDGAWKIFYKLKFSTYDAAGMLLVYGGRCNIANEVIDGLSLPTKAGKSITSQFFNNHIGIDIGNAPGDPVFAIADGEIVSGGWIDVGGYYTILHVKGINGGKDKWVYYGHMSPDGLITGTADKPVKVVAGQQLGATGEAQVKNPQGELVPNGKLTGPHLHFDIRLTPTEGQTADSHVNPCNLSIFTNGYPSLNCADFGKLGGQW
jgi:murein DD-endopeptidase MepM/ murein hydrolase activator NlpD